MTTGLGKWATAPGAEEAGRIDPVLARPLASSEKLRAARRACPFPSPPSFPNKIGHASPIDRRRFQQNSFVRAGGHAHGPNGRPTGACLVVRSLNDEKTKSERAKEQARAVGGTRATHIMR